MTDYEMLEVSSDDEAAVDDGEDEVLPTGAVRRRKIIIKEEYIPTSPLQLQTSRLKIEQMLMLYRIAGRYSSFVY